MSPLLERIKFLSIYSSNLDEFYRVRMPSLLALKKILKDSGEEQVYEEAKATIDRQQAYYGSLLKEKIIPALAANNIQFIYKQPIPGSLLQTVNDYFYNNIAAYLQPVLISNPELFFPENNKLYLAVVVERKESGQEQLYFVNIPSDRISRFFAVELDGVSYILFLDDMIRQHLTGLFPGAEIKGAYSVKITRDAELDLLDEYEGDLAEKMEKQLSKRDFGFRYPCTACTRYAIKAPGIIYYRFQFIACIDC
jgi:polyphosphate kinase